MRVNFNIISSWAIYKKQSLEKRYCWFYFDLGFCVLQVLKKCFAKFSPEICQELLETTLKFTFHFFRWEFSHKKSSSWSTSLTMKYISQENDNFKSHICISHLSRLWFLVNSWIHEPNAKTKGSWTLNS